MLRLSSQTLGFCASATELPQQIIPAEFSPLKSTGGKVRNTLELLPLSDLKNFLSHYD